MSRLPHKLYIHRGFTLVEMLVVMVIVSLLVVVVLQGFGYSLGMYQRTIKRQYASYSEVLAYDWFTSTLANQVAVRPKDRGLEATSDSLTTYTYQPLIGQQGLKTLIGWRIVQEANEASLEYIEGDQHFVTYRWLESSARFEYFDAVNQWQTRWPVEKSEFPALPVAVRLVVVSGGEAKNYVVSMKTRRQSEIYMDELLNGR